MRFEYLSVVGPGYNAKGECWRQGKYPILFGYYPTYNILKDTISNYYRTTGFILGIVKYFMRSTN